MEIYEATPDGEPRGAVIVVQEAFGVNDHIQDVTRRFAAAGYHAVAPAFFHRAGGGTAPYDDFAKVMPLFEGVTDDGISSPTSTPRIAHLEDAGLRPLADRHRRVLLRRPGDVPRRRAPGARRRGRLLRRRHRRSPAACRSRR